MLTRRGFLLGLSGALGAATVLGPSRDADATTYYDQYGNPVTVNVVIITAPVTVYDVYGNPIILYPASPTYVHTTPPVYGPAGVRGQARRVSRRTSRRVSNRNRVTHY